MYQYAKDATGGPPRLRGTSASRRPINGSPSSKPNPRRVVVVRRNKKGNHKLVLPLAAIAVLLATGGTVGMWYAATHITGGQVTAGNLDLAIEEELTWYDVSPDRLDNNSEIVTKLNLLTDNNGFYNNFFNTCLQFVDGACTGINEELVRDVGGTVEEGRVSFTAPKSEFRSAHLIECLDRQSCPDKDTWKMVPGDTIVGLVKSKLTLEGDNLVAGLEFECDELSALDWENLSQIPAFGSDIADLITVKTDLYITTPIGDKARPLDLAGALGGAHVNYLGYFEAPGEGQTAGVLDADWLTPTLELGSPVVTTLGRDPTATRDSVGAGEVTLMITIHFSETADERQLAALPLAQILSGRLALTQVRGASTPGQFIPGEP